MQLWQSSKPSAYFKRYGPDCLAWASLYLYIILFCLFQSVYMHVLTFSFWACSVFGFLYRFGLVHIWENFIFLIKKTQPLSDVEECGLHGLNTYYTESTCNVLKCASRTRRWSRRLVPSHLGSGKKNKVVLLKKRNQERIVLFTL